MNSLVVLFSVVALAVASPSVPLAGGVLTYAAPTAFVAPSAVSHQSRVDIKSTPAVVSTYTAAAPVAYAAAPIAAPVAYAAAPVAAPVTYAAAPAVVAAPAAVSHQSRVDIKSTPAVVSTYTAAAPVAYAAAPVAAPVAYAAAPVAAPVAYAAAPAAVSHQSRVDIKSTPAVVSTYTSPIAYSAPVVNTYAAPGFFAPGYTHAAFAAPLVASSVPLDTPEVAAAKAAHFEAKALAGAHLIKKRSVLATPIVSTYATSPVLSYSAPLTYAAPLTYSSPIVAPYTYPAYSSFYPKALSVHPY